MEKRADKLKKFCDNILSMNNKESELINVINDSLIKIANHKDVIQKQLIPLSQSLRTNNNLDTSLKINDVIVGINTLIQSNSSKIVNLKNEFIEVNRRNIVFHEELIKFLEEEYRVLGTLNLKNTLDKTKAKEKIEKNLYRIINAITNAGNLKELEQYLGNVVHSKINKILETNKSAIEQENSYLEQYIHFKLDPSTQIDFFKLESNLSILSQQISEQIELEKSSFISSFETHTKNKNERLNVVKGFLESGFLDRFKSKYVITKKDIKVDVKNINSSLIKEYEGVIIELTQMGFCVEVSHEDETQEKPKISLNEKEDTTKDEIVVVDADEEEVDEFAKKLASA